MVVQWILAPTATMLFTVFVSLLVALPMAAISPPVLTFLLPAVGLPIIARTRRFPTAWHPVMASTCPVPVTANPDIAHNRRGTDVLDSRWRRRHHYGLAIVVRAAGWHRRYHTTRQGSGCQEAGRRCPAKWCKS